MDTALQWSWLLIGLVTLIGVLLIGSTWRVRRDRLPTEHVVAATITAVLGWEAGVNAATSLGQIGLGSTENSLWIVGQLVVAGAGVVALALVLRRAPFGVPLAIGVCVMRLASAGIGLASIVGSGAVESDPNAGTFVFMGIGLALPALVAIFLFVSPYADGVLPRRSPMNGDRDNADLVAEGRP